VECDCQRVTQINQFRQLLRQHAKSDNCKCMVLTLRRVLGPDRKTSELDLS
jgi:hypothetical protein